MANTFQNKKNRKKYMDNKAKRKEMGDGDYSPFSSLFYLLFCSKCSLTFFLPNKRAEIRHFI